MAIKKLAKDLKPGDRIKLSPETALIESVKDLNVRIPSKSNNLLLITSKAKTGPFRDKEGEFVISGDEKIEVIPNDPWGKRALNWAKKHPESLFLVAVLAFTAGLYYLVGQYV